METQGSTAPSEGAERTTVAASVAEVLGGRRLLKREIRSKLDVHEVITARIPSTALHRILARFGNLRQDDLAHALGMSVRTIQRLLEKRLQLLTKEQSGRTWKLGEVLVLAIDVFGTPEKAVTWLKTPAIALEQRRPLDLLGTVAGTEAVEQLLQRIASGVYT
jgi:putative toxin-antitoxin system antitoxin component (TIGR02293 family)